MFKITIEGATAAELVAAMHEFVAETTGNSTHPPVEPAKPRRTPKAKVEEPDEQPLDDTDKELLEEVPCAPKGSTTVVDAGTGKPAGAPVQMTFDDVKKAAARLSVKDTPKLEEIIKKYGATKLSEVPKDKLGDFATDVMEALG